MVLSWYHNNAGVFLAGFLPVRKIHLVLPTDDTSHVVPKRGKGNRTRYKYLRFYPEPSSQLYEAADEPKNVGCSIL